VRRILITGSNRGIGLDLARRYLQHDDTLIFATCRKRSTATALNELAEQHPQRLTVIELDVTDQASIGDARRQVGRQVDGLEILINNAGILPGGVAAMESPSARFGFLEASAMMDVLQVNTVAPVLVTQAFADLLRRGTNARVINVSSDAGSITLRTTALNYSYQASKAALNMMTRCLASDFRVDGVTVISIHPGWIQTDMGGPHAIRTPADTIPGMMKVIDGLTMADTGEFFKWDGTRIPW
jgi:NAD(P)-dependent dehydrogenase (short-subunit alcohol dehydrogenase family)